MKPATLEGRPVRVENCYACDRYMGQIERAHTSDGQSVFVGVECFRKIKRAGAEGYQPPKGGPRLFADLNLAVNWSIGQVER